jgi:pimeloyl-[acyl-carrier protein] methyl ester esterase
MKKLLIISGWAHSTHAIEPMGKRLANQFKIELLSGAEALQQPRLPEADAILTGSMGGLIAFERLPRLCKKVVLLSGTACFCKKEGYRHGTAERILGRMINQLEKDPESLLEAFFNNVHAPQKPSRQHHPYPPIDIPSLRDGLIYLRDTDLRTQIPSLKASVLLMHGTADHIIPLAAAHWLSQHLPTSQLITYEGLGHALAAHAFEQTMQAAERFLA